MKLETLPKILEKQALEGSMSDTAIAAEKLRELVGDRGPEEYKYQLVGRAYEALRKINSKWTRRRVRSLWSAEAPRVDYREIIEIERAIALKEARRKHAAYLAETKRMADALTVQDESFHGPEIERLRGVVRGMDRP